MHLHFMHDSSYQERYKVIIHEFFLTGLNLKTDSTTKNRRKQLLSVITKNYTSLIKLLMNPKNKIEIITQHF